VFGFWHRLDNLATFMAHLDDVRVTGPTSSHWVASALTLRTGQCHVQRYMRPLLGRIEARSTRPG
jgi:uncharacterized membrane protein